MEKDLKSKTPNTFICSTNMEAGMINIIIITTKMDNLNNPRVTRNNSSKEQFFKINSMKMIMMTTTKKNMELPIIKMMTMNSKLIILTLTLIKRYLRPFLIMQLTFWNTPSKFHFESISITCLQMPQNNKSLNITDQS